MSGNDGDGIDLLDGVPCQLLGYRITTRTQICLSCLATAVLQLLVYLVVTVADIGCTVQHFRDGNQLYANLTLGLLYLPALGCFCAIVTSPYQWPTDIDRCERENWLFFGKQLFNFLLFPIAAIYRNSYIIFWSIEALFHEQDTYERYHAVRQATKPSTIELYYFLQAFLQSAPQIILQLYILLRENIFRNYETCLVQMLSVIFSLITMAIIVGAYQRIESQKVVGKNYPWIPEELATNRRTALLRNKSIPEDKSPSTPYVELPGSDYVMDRFYSINKENPSEEVSPKPSTSMVYDKKSLHLGEYNLNKDNNYAEEHQKTLDFSDENGIYRKRPESCYISEIEDNIENRISNESPENNTNVRQSSIRRHSYTQIETIDENSDQIDNTDYSPICQAPMPPVAISTSPSVIPNMQTEVVNRLSTIKNMLILDAELYIKERVPRLPTSLFDHDKENAKHTDETDFILPMPTRKKCVKGLEEEDFVGKSVAFTSWILFLFTRMLSLSMFAVFYPRECAYLCLGHYIWMLVWLCYETKFEEKLERTYFYLFLAYVYVFTIMEFKIKFRKPRHWYIGYVGLVFIQNLTITLIWYIRADWESWWFRYIFSTLALSFTYSIACLLLYFVLLKPRDKVLFVNE